MDHDPSELFLFGWFDCLKVIGMRLVNDATDCLDVCVIEIMTAEDSRSLSSEWLMYGML